MEKSLNLISEKSGSFPRFGRRKHKVDIDSVSFRSEGAKAAEDCDDDDDEKQYPDEPGLNFDHDKIMEQVHQFIQNLASVQDKSKPPKIPNSVDIFFKMVDYMIATYEHRESSAKFGQNQNEDALFFEALSCLEKIIKSLDEFEFHSSSTHCFNRAGSVQHRAMLLSERDLIALLDILKYDFDTEINKSKTEIQCPHFQPETIANMNRVATAMISAGYDAECSIVYRDQRLKALDAEFTKQDYENMSMDESQKMDWDSLEGDIDNWIRIVKHCVTNLFSVERKLCDSVFEHHPLTAQRLFSDLTTSVTTRLLNFPNALVLIKQYAAEKLFKFLDVHETLRDFISVIADNKNLISEISVTQHQIGEAAVSIFCQLENSIKSDKGRVPVSSGTVHPLTRYTMNYLKYACEYKDTLEQIFQPRHNEANESKVSIEARESNSHFAVRLMMVMDLLDDNIETKSNLYRDPSLRYIFLMNNGRYIWQKIKSSTDIYEMMGESWWRKRTSNLRQYHKNYQRETWGKVLQCISHEGLQVNGKVPKAQLKERFKTFNNMFDDILKTQSSWLVSDEQLKSELRVSISAVVIPAYRSFLGKYKPQFTGKKADKYIKYQPEDIESLIDQLFEGDMPPVGRKKHNLFIPNNLKSSGKELNP